MGKRTWGTVRRLPSGRWQARYPDARGRHVPAPGTFATKTDGARWLAQVETDQARGDFVDPRAGRVAFGDFATSWVANRPGLRARTREEYAGLLERHLLPTFGEDLLIDILPSAVRGWFAELERRYPVTAAAAYRLLRAVMNTAVEDDLLARSPCRLKGASIAHSPERPLASVAEVAALADAMPDELAVAVVLAAWCGLRRGELLGLRRRDIDLTRRTVRVERGVNELKDTSLEVGPPKTPAGVRTVAIPPHVLRDIAEHLDRFTGSGPDAWLFPDADGGPLRPHRLTWPWRRARAAIGRPDLHLHDLRHTSNTWAAATGASTKELMRRYGHASPAAALRYQHATEDRDQVIADAMTELILPAPVIPISAGNGTAMARRRHGERKTL